MLALFFLAFLIGAFLGMRFKVVILIPAIAFVLMAAVLIGIARSEHFIAVSLQVAIAVGCLEIGYFCSVVMWLGIALVRSRRLLRTESVR
jgi:hypothetical protein